jgi:uncharacterized protein with GYD domain
MPPDQEVHMPYYLLQISDSPEGWQALMKQDLEKRLQVVYAVVEKLGGKIGGCWSSFGDYDWVVICQMPENISAAALAIAMSAGGAIKAFRTTPLLTVKETAAALHQAASCGYQPPKP